MEIRPQRTGFSSAGVSFSQFTDSRARPRLPKIKVLNKESVNELMASIKEVTLNKKMIEHAGPSPGVFSIANTRKKLHQSPTNNVSFKRVGIK